MTKKEYIRAYFDFILGEKVKDLSKRLDKLMEEDKITAGARYYVYGSDSWYGVKLFEEIISGANKAKNYIVYINCRKKWDFEYAWKDIQKNYRKAIKFVEEQEALPFEESQMQILKKEGKLWSSKEA